MANRSRGSLADRAAETVQRGIVTGDYRPGQLYSVQFVADTLGMSRSPAREGLVRLAESGLIQFRRNRGFVVVPTEARDIAEIFTIRLALECPAARRAATRPQLHAAIDEAFADLHRAAVKGDKLAFRAADLALHEAIMVSATSRRAAEIVKGLRESTVLIQAPTWMRTRTLSAVADEHRPILEAITAGDPDGAEAAMQSHLQSTAVLLMAQVMGVPADDVDVGALWREIAGDM